MIAKHRNTGLQVAIKEIETLRYMNAQGIFSISEA